MKFVLYSNLICDRRAIGQDALGPPTNLLFVAVEKDAHYFVLQIMMVNMLHPVLQLVYVYLHILVVVNPLLYLYLNFSKNHGIIGLK